MLILAATNESLELVTSYAVGIDYSTSFVDITTTTFAPSGGHGTVATAATTSIVSAPAASTQRQIKMLTARNIGQGSQTLYIQKNVGGALYRITPNVVLAAGEMLEYVDGMGFSVLDPFARGKQAVSATIANVPGQGSEFYIINREAERLLTMLLAELQVTNRILVYGLNLPVSPDSLRDNPDVNLT